MNFSITINGEGPELANALKTLREVMDGKQIGEGSVTASIQPPVAPPAAPVQTATPQLASQAYQQQQDFSYQGQPTGQYTPSQQTYAPPVAQTPVQQQFTPPPTGVVPTSAPSYSMEQLGVAAGAIVDAGRSPELIAWLNARGAGALTQLDKSYYGEFANYLRSLGAKI